MSITKSRVAEDGRQQVVEVVRHAAGELPDGFHLLRLTELRLERFALADIHADAEPMHRLVLRVARQPGAAGDPMRAAIGPEHAEFLLEVRARAVQPAPKDASTICRSSGWMSRKKPCTSLGPVRAADRTAAAIVADHVMLPGRHVELPDAHAGRAERVVSFVPRSCARRPRALRATLSGRSRSAVDFCSAVSTRRRSVMSLPELSTPHDVPYRHRAAPCCAIRSAALRQTS